MATPNVRVYLDLSAGTEYNAATAIDITSSVASVSVRRGKQRILNDFEFGQASVTLYDASGDFNPNNPLSPYYPDLTITKKIKIVVNPSGLNEYPIYMGYIAKFDTNFSQNTDEISQITLQLADGFRIIEAGLIDSVPGASAQLSGTRIEKILDDIDWPVGMRFINSGRTICQADPGTTRTALSAIRVVEKTEAGAFFIDREGYARFLDRDAVYKTTSSVGIASWVRFIDYPINDYTRIFVQYNNATVRLDDDLLYNDITVQRSGGTAQTQIDATSSLNFGLRSASRSGMLMQTDQEASDLAGVLLATLKDPSTRIDEIRVDISDITPANNLENILNYELLDAIYIEKTMPDGSQLIVPTSLIQGFAYDFKPGRATVTFYVGEPLIKGFILDDQVYGTLDYNYLGY